MCSLDLCTGASQEDPGNDQGPTRTSERDQRRRDAAEPESGIRKERQRLTQVSLNWLEPAGPTGEAPIGRRRPATPAGHQAEVASHRFTSERLKNNHKSENGDY